MRKVLIKKWIPVQWIPGKEQRERIVGTGRWSDDFEIEGIFHQWGISFEELSETTVQITVGIIEISNGTIMEVATSNIKFVEPLNID